MSVRILLGDVLEKLAELADESVHCVVTSPPYLGLRNYGVAGQIGLEPTPDAYVAVMVEVFREVRRVMRPDATLFLNLGDSYQDKQLLGLPWRVAFALQADGWILRSEIIWHKPNPMPESVTDRPTKAHEQIFLLSKSPKYHYDAEAIAEPSMANPGQPRHQEMNGHSSPQLSGRGGFVTENRNRRSVWTVATAPFSGAHFAVFPPALIEPCILAGCPKDCCAKCGAPVVRQTMPSERYAKHLGRGFNDHSGDQTAGMMQNRGVNRQNLMMKDGITCKEMITTGWHPTCACDAGTVPGTVLDCFGGAGTTGLVADRLQRDAILIELSPAYAAMAESRITGDAPLFAKVVP